MITVRLMGGLSNQMFQYAAARALAEKHRTYVRLDLSWFDSIPDTDTPRHFELDCFRLEKHIDRPNPVIKLKRRLLPRSIYRERDLTYSAKLLQQPDNTTIIGYFQSEKYFKDIAPIIQKDFSWSESAKGKNKTLLKHIEQDEFAVSLHVRRGDYVTNKNAHSFHGVLGLDYYRKSLKYIARYVKSPHLYVFSNDPTWCKENLKFNQPMTFIDHNDDITSGPEDMRLMKACRHNIIANSSMSWWGAWLNNNPNKIIIAPKQWFADQKLNTKDLIPSSWQRL